MYKILYMWAYIPRQYIDNQTCRQFFKVESKHKHKPKSRWFDNQMTSQVM